MSDEWTSGALGRIDAAPELEIATRRADGSLRRWIPIWVVAAEGCAYVRTWYRRDTGWYGHVLDTPRARVRVPGLERDVVVVDVGLDDAVVRAAVDDAYRAKYGGGVDRMVCDDAARTTLRLDPAPES